MSTPLNPLTLPLWGSRLIEASAGTGKTWTLAALVLRLVLGHGGVNAFARPLQPAQILVMTFTRAATRELSERIRARLLEAARCFRNQGAPQPGDDFLAELLAAYPDGEARTLAAWRLALAAEAMDDAAVHTIDAWCQRMLREHAFDSGGVFDETLAADETAMLRDAALDYWRQQVYPLQDVDLQQVLAVWPQVQRLIDDAQRLIEQPLPAEAGQGSLAERIEAGWLQRSQDLAQLKDGWMQRANEMERWLDRQHDNGSVLKVKLHARHYKVWLAALRCWAEDPLCVAPDLKTGATRLTPAGLAEVFRPGVLFNPPPPFAAFDRLMRALEQLPSPSVALRAHAAINIAQRLAALKARAGSFGFADMLKRLDDALDLQLNPSAARLRQRIREQFPVALIDEFQDTSPLQSRIFDRLYGLELNDPDNALLLIGDPKQSIYGFRGADIYSYLAARRATEGRRHVLGTNHRSTAALVAGVNAVFCRADGQVEGAFMLRPSGALFGDDPLPFEPVRAHGRDEVFVSSPDQPFHGAALGFELEPRLLDTRTSRREFAARCAEHIVRLLNDPQAGFRKAGRGGLRRLVSADIAVLVRTGREAAAVRRELSRREVPSVYLSDRDSVFASDEARDLLHWLRAVASPGDSRLVRAALATTMIGLTVEELRQMAGDDPSFDERAAHLRQLRAVWQTQGVLSMLRQTLHVFGLPARWLDLKMSGDGERRLTNHMHLAELLQTASAHEPGEQSLIRWLADQRESGTSDGDERIVRLESDAERIKVVTVHKAKGLEYPLVFLPFACHFRAVAKARLGFVSLPDTHGQRQLHLEPTAEQVALADKERQREDLRLLYVALTRARHRLWVGLAALKTGNRPQCLWHRSAIGYALGGAQECPADALRGQVEALLRSSDENDGQSLRLVMARPVAELACTRLEPRHSPAPLPQVLPYAADFDRHWSIGSYSSMVRSLAPATAWASSLALPRDDEVPAGVEATPDVPAAATTSDAPWHALVGGASTGTLLHEVLEWLAGEGLGKIDTEELRQQLLRRCRQQGFGAQAPEVLAWLSELLNTPLPPLGTALKHIDRTLPEMEFWLPSDDLPSTELDALCRAHLLPGLPRPPLPPRRLRGMLMGFADLVFEHRGRYWVLDYKSNRLGRSDADYDAATLAGAMAAHRYDVQGALYLVALHRLLCTRLGTAYDPVKHLGGALFVFARGIRGPQRGCVHLGAPPALLDGLDAALARAGSAAT
ncbi:MAG: exodeoxyribonuclease V subunit beta [Rubrivivax sp.]